jgi:hypothetical protein
VLRTTAAYWVGLQSPGAGQPYAFLDGTPATQAASNSPYAHWGAAFGSRAGLGMGCVVARAALAYDFYLGGAAASEQAQQQLYQTSGTADKKWAHTHSPHLRPPSHPPC